MTATAITLETPIPTEQEDDLRPEYDLKKLLKKAVRGKYTKRYQAGTNLVLLALDVASAFPNAQAVNDALRLVMQLAKIPAERIKQDSLQSSVTP
ncbi:MAG: hypothetical protein U0175_33055 [Caldilineaceae bacterium]